MFKTIKMNCQNKKLKDWLQNISQSFTALNHFETTLSTGVHIFMGVKVKSLCKTKYHVMKTTYPFLN
jgi:hypothetical protein